MAGQRWDLTALLNAADPNAPAVERHLWMVRLLEWLRSVPAEPAAAEAAPAVAAPVPATVELAPPPAAEPPPPAAGNSPTPWPLRRLRHLLNMLDRNPEHRERISVLLQRSMAGLDATGLLADFGFSPRQGFFSELAERLRLATLPGTPQTQDLGELFLLLFEDDEAETAWIEAIDNQTLHRTLALFVPDADARPWRAVMVESIQLLASQFRASGLSAEMRQRMDPALRTDRPFHQVVQAAEGLRASLRELQDDAGSAHAMQALAQQAHYLRAVLAAGLTAADSVRGHLDDYGISVDLVFQINQLRGRAERMEALLACLMGSDPAPDLRRLLGELVRAGIERRGIGKLFTRHYALLARKVTERSADTGEHYITRDSTEYRDMLRMAAGGGAVIGLTTMVKFMLTALALPAFWAGFSAGSNYAISFVVIYLLHWTVATKQPAMTAPSLARRLEGISSSDAALQRFVDEVAHLLRSQFAGIVGNLSAVVPVVLGLQILSWLTFGAPLIGQAQAHYALHSTTLLGPTALYAAFTGVLLFASSLIAGWAENWFVFHRLDSAIAWNPRFIQRLGAARALRWSRWWRDNIAGVTANVSLGMMLGLVPALAGIFGLPLEVRHVTLSTGQIFAALGTLGWPLLNEPGFWWCIAGIPVTGLLNLGVSFALAFRLAMVSQGLKLRDRGRIYAALRQRWRQAPGSFFKPSKPPA
ncbi:MAG TPA: site-specific recombinase [Ideonella sp.]|uniref:site-specific recombinase n=1 Tax=Ideonella sp. TaxID=1929293 RepID=UPI002BD002F6|nr:site-specific recombinase [Ideonella sp.]HSI50789.1 site-specific recombinase [Ideonella sp.]